MKAWGLIAAVTLGCATEPLHIIAPAPCVCPAKSPDCERGVATSTLPTRAASADRFVYDPIAVELALRDYPVRPTAVMIADATCTRIQSASEPIASALEPNVVATIRQIRLAMVTDDGASPAERKARARVEYDAALTDYAAQVAAKLQPAVVADILGHPSVVQRIEVALTAAWMADESRTVDRVAYKRYFEPHVRAELQSLFVAATARCADEAVDARRFRLVSILNQKG